MPRLHLHLVSDSTGETLEMLTRAALARFEAIEVRKHFWPLVRGQDQLDRVLTEVAATGGLVLHTIADPALRGRLEARAGLVGLPLMAPLDPLTDRLGELLGQPADARPGKQHALDDAYFRRVDAIQFSVDHDDGHGADNWNSADIVLTGVSRTSKTPTSIYLANRGYRCANVPLVPGCPVPPALLALDGPLVVGLTSAPTRLAEVRRNRLGQLNQGATDYVDEQAIRAEVTFARRLFADKGWPVIDVTRRSIEETAAAIIKLAEDRAEVREADG